MASHTASLTIVYENEQLPTPAEFSLDGTTSMQRLGAYIQALAAGHRIGSLTIGTDNGNAVAATGTIACSGTSHGVAATGSYALTNVGGAMATGSFTYSGSSGTTTATVNGFAFQQTVGADMDRATELAGQINIHPTLQTLVAAAAVGGVVTIDTFARGASGNSITLAASGTGLISSGATLTGGMDGAVTVAINGTTVGPVSTTNQTDAAAAVTVATAIEANGTLGPLLAAVASTNNVLVTWGTQGTVGNAVTLGIGVSTTGTATRSGATLTGGVDTSVTVTINGVGIVCNTTITTTDANVATVIQNTINASVDPLVEGLVTAMITSPTTTVRVTADTPGAAGNATTLAATGTGLTASGPRLTGGSDDTTTVTVTR